MFRFGRSTDLTRPSRGGVIGPQLDPDAFGRFSEGIARFLGTGRFLVAQTVAVVAWITLNAFAWGLQWDPYPFILLNLMFSTQAAYAAPLILLAQNRQDDRDRAQAERDREVNARTQAEAEFLARELASVRLTLADVVTIEELEDSVSTLVDAVESLGDRLDAALAAGDTTTVPSGTARADRTSDQSADATPDVAPDAAPHRPTGDAGTGDTVRAHEGGTIRP